MILQEKNFKVIETVSGESTDTYLFFIGGHKQNLIAKAKLNMIESSRLLDTLKAKINVTFEEHDAYKFVYIKRIITAHGTVIEFLE